MYVDYYTYLAELAQQFRDAHVKVVFCMEYALETVLAAQAECPLLKASGWSLL